MRVCPRCRSIYSSQVEKCLADGERVVDEKHYPLVGETLDRYRIIAPIGEGAMGCVYRATHTVLPREYAIKVLFRDFAGNATQIERFRREAQAASTMSHQNIVSVADFVSLPSGLTFIVMELVAGQTLERAIQAQAPFNSLRVAHIAKQIAAGLGEAHRMGFVHRDVKPSNIMLSPHPKGEQVKILDFGVVGIGAAPIASRLTGIGHIIGTPTYMAPEQVHDPGVGPAADLYALGVIMFEMLSGEPPFTGVDRTEVFIKHISEPAPQLPPADGLELLVSWLLEKMPEKRPKRADEVIRAIDRLAIGEHQQTGDITIPPPPRAPSTMLELDTDSELPQEHIKRELADTDPERNAQQSLDTQKKGRSSDEMFPSLAMPASQGSNEWANWDPDGSYASLRPLEHNDTIPMPDSDPTVNPLSARPRVISQETEKSMELPVPETQIVRSRSPVFEQPTDLLYLDEPELPNLDGLRTRPNTVDDAPTQVDFDITAAHNTTIPAEPNATIPTPIVLAESAPTESSGTPAQGPMIQPMPSDEALDLRHVVTVLDNDTIDEDLLLDSDDPPAMDGFADSLGRSGPPSIEDDEDSGPPLVKPLRAPEIPAADGDVVRAVEGLRKAESQATTAQDTVAPLVYSSKTRTDVELQPTPVRSSQELDAGFLDRGKVYIVLCGAFLAGSLLVAMILWILRR